MTVVEALEDWVEKMAERYCHTTSSEQEVVYQR